MDVAIRHSPSFAAARISLAANEQFRAESGAMMATSSGVEITSSTQGGVMKGLKRSVLGGESLFVTTFTAPPAGGWVDVAHHLAGDIDTIELAAGESVTIDTGHVVAFEPSTTSQIRKVAGGVIQTLKSGEGFVFDFTGPGWVMTQTRNPAALQAWIRQIMPGETGGAGAAGVLGGLLGR